MTAYATVATAVTAIRLGAYDYLVKPFEPEEVSLMIQKIVNQQALVRETEVLRKVLKREHRFRDMVSKSPAMQSIFTLARAAARSQSTVLVLGESGTGKEVLARAIHLDSPRAGRPFVAVSCAALPDSLLESELFGHERGAFTGALTRRIGKFEAADGGTLFLDEIGDVSGKLQLDLLRVLEERRFFRVGGTEAVSVDVRIIAATNRDLRKESAEGRFREDLFYRLNVVPIVLPPLRDRREDIPLLVEQLLEQLGAEQNRRIEGVSAEAMASLVSHDWPGNIRELRNVLERAIVVATGAVLQAAGPRHARADRRRPRPRRPAVARGGRAAPHRQRPPPCRWQREPDGAAARHRPRHALQQDAEVQPEAPPRDRRRLGPRLETLILMSVAFLNSPLRIATPVRSCPFSGPAFPLSPPILEIPARPRCLSQQTTPPIRRPATGSRDHNFLVT